MKKTDVYVTRVLVSLSVGTEAANHLGSASAQFPGCARGVADENLRIDSDFR